MRTPRETLREAEISMRRSVKTTAIGQRAKFATDRMTSDRSLAPLFKPSSPVLDRDVTPFSLI